MRHGQAPSDVHHPGPLHDAPPAMALALVVLAVGSVLAGYVGLPHVMGPNLLADWLAPASPPRRIGRGAADDTALELTLMAVSTLIALGGIGTACVHLAERRREIADRLAARFAGVYRLLLNKYYVDEAYDAAVVHPIRARLGGRALAGVDVRVIDGAVNGTAAFVAGGAMVLRRLQTGSVRRTPGRVIGTVVILWVLPVAVRHRPRPWVLLVGAGRSDERATCC
jgi:NADH-quinone oxidoreductase subunit L